MVRHHEFLDGVGDVRDHLHGAAEIIARAFLGDHGLIDAPRGDVVGLRRRNAGEAFVMAEVEIGLRPVIGDVNLAVLKRRHRPRIDVEIGIQLPQPHAITACLQKRSESGRRKTFSQGRDHAAGDEDQPRHGRPTCRRRDNTSSGISRGRQQFVCAQCCCVEMPESRRLIAAWERPAHPAWAPQAPCFWAQPVATGPPVPG